MEDMDIFIQADMAAGTDSRLFRSHLFTHHIKYKNMKTTELLKKIEEKFGEKLEVKTGWGKNEVKSAYQSAVIEVLSELTEKLIEK
jgi:PP-loop superfamily ATP-utilizing enzyme